jgi:hypothetical protein
MLARAVTVAAVAALALLGAAPGASAPQYDLLVRHGQGIGKLRLGMTLPQVKGLLGPPRATNKKERRGRGGDTYLELDWDWSWWTVGFVRRAGGRYQAVMIGTVSRSQRTREGLAVGSSRDQLSRRLRGLRCWAVQSPRRGEGDTGFETHECVFGEPAGRTTAFILDQSSWLNPDGGGVAGIEVRAPGFYRARPGKLCPLGAVC